MGPYRQHPSVRRQNLIDAVDDNADAAHTSGNERERRGAAGEANLVASMGTGGASLDRTTAKTNPFAAKT